MLRKEGDNFIYRAAAVIFLSGIFILMPLLSFADDGDGGDFPCGDPRRDPILDPCPLDTWVWILAIIGLVFGAMYLYRQQKAKSLA
jgi:hypothetical protein